ncbi:hypothetical protein LCGC14_0627940 [marine sediment metagenome]|uniref:Uncharacterized protein n=1 Tax=marine sediment metagenome TaxID=412755 RepID=A0A0F9R801_9ZZZZ
MTTGKLSDKDWDKFLRWCRERWPLWMPHKVSIEKFLEWKKVGKK